MQLNTHGLKPLPEGLEKYSETKIFDEMMIPAKLRDWHDTKAGTWGLLVIHSGSIDFIFKAQPEQTITLVAGQTLTIEPTVLHRVEVTGAVEMQVEFYRQA